MLMFFALVSFEAFGQICDGATIVVTADVASGVTDNQHAATTLTANNTIKNGGVANYKAGTKISLTAGFKVEVGATFSAHIEACTLSSNTFVTKWSVNAGETITIPTVSGESYGYTVNWGDGSTDTTVYSGDASHTYTTTSTPTITITGTFPRIFFNNSGDKDKIIEIVDWGDMVWTSMENAFYGCSNLDIIDTDAPDLTNVTDLSRMFKDCSSLNADINNWTVNNVTHMVGMLENATSFNHSLEDWEIAGAADMSNAFDYCGMSYQNLDTTLISWETYAVNNTVTDVTLGIAGLTFCSAGNSVTNLINNYDWSIAVFYTCRSLSTSEEEFKGFKIYPNPVNDFLKVEVDQNILKNLRFQVFDLSGRLLLEDKGKKELDVSSLTNGVYILKVLGDSQRSFKFIKN